MKRGVLILIVLCLPYLVFAQAKPTLAEIQKVLSYYYDGKGNPVVLVEKKLCEEVFKEGDEKFNCKGEFDSNVLKQGEKAIIWMNFFGPEGDKFDILVQYDRNGITRHSTSLKVTGAIRYRANSAIVTSKPGNWKINIYLDGDEQTTLLDTVEYKVTK